MFVGRSGSAVDLLSWDVTDWGAGSVGSRLSPAGPCVGLHQPLASGSRWRVFLVKSLVSGSCNGREHGITIEYVRTATATHIAAMRLQIQRRYAESGPQLGH